MPSIYMTTRLKHTRLALGAAGGIVIALATIIALVAVTTLARI